MKIKNTLRNLVQTLTHAALKCWAGPARTFSICSKPIFIQKSTNPTIQLDFDEPTDSGLLLREAIPVRSAEYWMEMGYPELALEELRSLPEPVRRHPWPRSVLQQATLATAH